MKDHACLEKLRRMTLTATQQQRLFARVDDIFQCAVHSRSPRERPPGKAGLRAEKGYYRLLYLEGDLHQKVNLHAQVNPGASVYDWDHMIVILGKLADIPDLQSEILQQIESALDEIGADPSTFN